MKLNRNKKILLGLVCILFVFGLYKYFGNIVEGLSGQRINNYTEIMRSVKLQLEAVTEFNTLKVINTMNNHSNVTQSVTDLKKLIDDVKNIHTKIIDAGSFSKDKKKAKKQRDGIKDAKNKADASYDKAVKSYEKTLSENPPNPERGKPGSSMIHSEALIYYIKRTLDTVKYARTYLDD